jgi:MFS family permease
MTVLLIATLILTNMFAPRDNDDDDNKNNNKDDSAAQQKASEDLHKDFMLFRNQYILVYLVIMLADWMQGTHMYTLYLSYNVNISALFLTGFLSGAFFAAFLGSAVDKFGRKNSCIVYCVLDIILNTLEHSTNFGILLVGRVLGGISTNLLFSAFESWMTTEHRKRGFPEEWLSRTYSAVSIYVAWWIASIVKFGICQSLMQPIHLTSSFQLPSSRFFWEILIRIGFDWERYHGHLGWSRFSGIGGSIWTQ